MKHQEESVVDYVAREITECCSYMPVIYLETTDRTLIYRLLAREDCFSILRKGDSGENERAVYNRDDKNIINVKFLDKHADLINKNKIPENLRDKPYYFVIMDFDDMASDVSSSVSSRKIVPDYIKTIYDKNSAVPLKQNLILVSPVSMSVGIDPDSMIPPGFAQYIQVIDVPLLGIQDIAQEVTAVQNPVLERAGRSKITAEDFLADPDVYTETLKGMSRSQISYVLHELKDEFGAVSHCGMEISPKTEKRINEMNRKAGEIIARQKRQDAAKSGDILYVDIQDEVVPGGIDGIAEWIGQKKHILDEPQRAHDYGIRFPKGILMAGLPGSGKSLTAQYIAGQLHLPLIQFKMDMVLEGIVGSSEQRMRQILKLFEASAPCVIWIDEIEKELSGTGSNENDGGVAKRCLATLLNWMQTNTKNCFIYATANHTEDLPQELLRRGRFDRLYYTYLPMEEQCLEILVNQILHLKERAPDLFDHSINPQSIREMGERLLDSAAGTEHRFFTGSDLEGLVSDAQALMFCDTTRDIKKNPYRIHELEEACVRAMKNLITYGESNYIGVLDYWIALQSHPFHNAAVKENLNEASGETADKYRYMLFDFSDLQYDGSQWYWREGLSCRSRYQYDQNMFRQLKDSIPKRISVTFHGPTSAGHEM